MSDTPAKSRVVHDIGHQGDVDVPQIEALLRLTPIERLRRHEEWRLVMKRALRDAELRRTNHS